MVYTRTVRQVAGLKGFYQLEVDDVFVLPFPFNLKSSLKSSSERLRDRERELVRSNLVSIPNGNNSNTKGEVIEADSADIRGRVGVGNEKNWRGGLVLEKLRRQSAHKNFTSNSLAGSTRNLLRTTTAATGNWDDFLSSSLLCGQATRKNYILSVHLNPQSHNLADYHPQCPLISPRVKVEACLTDQTYKWIYWAINTRPLSC